MTVAGRGPLEPALRDLATELGLDRSVQFVGHQSETGSDAALRGRALLVLASHEEVWGLVANEALASGMHVVVTSNCGVAASLHGMDRRLHLRAWPRAAETGDGRSRAHWAGWIDVPEILEHDGDRFARDLDHALTGADHG